MGRGNQRKKEKRQLFDQLRALGRNKATTVDDVALSEGHAAAVPGEAPEVEAKAGAPGAGPKEAAPAPSKKLSKSQLRKVRKVEDTKRKRDERVSLLGKLKEHSLSDDQLKLLRPIARMGRESKKDRQGIEGV